MPHTTAQNPFLSQIHPLPVTRMGAIPPHSLPGFGCLGHSGPSLFLKHAQYVSTTAVCKLFLAVAILSHTLTLLLFQGSAQCQLI